MGSDSTAFRPDSEPNGGSLFHLPPEWACHAATWLAWPRHDGISFPGLEAEAQEIWLRLAGVVSRYEMVHINVFDTAYYREVRRRLKRYGAGTKTNCQIHIVPAYEPWVRDHGPIFVFPNGGSTTPFVTNWSYNAWGGKYPPWDLDDEVPERVAELLGCPTVSLPWVLEGGAIETNGAGVLLASRTCLLNSNRNGPTSRPFLEEAFRRFFGADHVVWIDGELEGDDTDGHVDQLARFASERVLLVASTDDRTDPNYPVLKELRRQLDAELVETGLIDTLVPLPIPPRILFRGQRLPMSYLNYYFVNGAVIVPVYEEATDAHALGILQDLLPDREVVPFPARTMIWGLGAVHCATQQQPASPWPRHSPSEPRRRAGPVRQPSELRD